MKCDLTYGRIGDSSYDLDFRVGRDWSPMTDGFELMGCTHKPFLRWDDAFRLLSDVFWS